MTAARPCSPAGSRRPTRRPLDAPITYTLTGSTIAANVPYLALVRRGGSIGGVANFEWWYEAETFPKLDVKLANTGSRTAFITAATAHVDRSVPDREPVPIVFAGRPETPRTFSLADEGWGNMENVTLTYDVVSRVVKAGFERRGRYVATRDSDGFFNVSKGIRSRKLSPHGVATVWGVLSYRWRDS